MKIVFFSQRHLRLSGLAPVRHHRAEEQRALELEAAQVGAGEQIARETAMKVSHVGQEDLILGPQ